MKPMLVILFAAAMLFGCRSQQDKGAQEAQEPTAGAAQGEQPGQAPEQPAAGQPAAGQPAQQQEQMATGTITEVQDNQITMRTADGEQMEMKLGDNAQITMNGQPMQRERLQQGANVRAAYRDEAGEMTVDKLEIQSLGGAAQPGQQPGSPEMQQQPPSP